MSQFSTILAGAAARFPECSHLKSFGQFGVLSRCTVVSADFNERMTACGFQLIWSVNGKQFTLQADAKTIV